MIIYPNHNIINGIYRYCNKTMSSNIVLNANQGILKLLLDSIDSFHCIIEENEKRTNLIYDLFNVDIYLTTDYIQHSQNRDIYKKYHIKELLLFTDPPTQMLKREDLMLLAERLDDTYKVIIGSDKIESSWSFMRGAQYVAPGIPHYELNLGDREGVCVLHDNSGPAQKLCRILTQQYPELKTISQFDNYNIIMETLNSYKVCINLNSCVDSLYALYGGCSVIASIRAYEYEKTYENIEHILYLISQELSSFDIKEKIHIHNTLAKYYNYEIFIDNISKLISKYTKEPFYI